MYAMPTATNAGIIAIRQALDFGTGKAVLTAILGWFPRGPLNTAVRIQSISDFEREFGGLHRDSEASYALPAAAIRARAEIIGADFVKARGGRVLRVALEPELSTTALIQRILERYGKAGVPTS